VEGPLADIRLPLLDLKLPGVGRESGEGTEKGFDLGGCRVQVARLRSGWNSRDGLRHHVCRVARAGVL